jgi:hypothetical protein
MLSEIITIKKRESMKRRNLLLLLCGITPFLTFAQDKADTTKAWKKGGMISINFNQTVLTHWAAGGQNSIAGNGLLNVFDNYKKGKTTWDNSAELGYGVLRSGIHGPLFKSDDKIDISSKWGRQAFYKVNYSALINFKSQFTKGYNYPNDSVIISDFLAPGYVLVALGLDYKPNDDLSLFVSPATGKFTIVRVQSLADAGAFGVDPAVRDSSGNIIEHGEMLREEFGAYITFKYKKKLGENVVFTTKLDLFSNYFHDFGNIDVNWDAQLSMKVNKYLSASVATTLIYDDDIDIPLYTGDVITGYGPRTQFREVLAVGFSMKF